ncbi:hypothetical protein ACYULU_16580, partial [Breznakiellaceae bacterium SP9]
MPIPQLTLTPNRDIKKNLTTKYTKNTLVKQVQAKERTEGSKRKKLLPFVLFVPLVVDFSSFLFCESRLKVKEGMTHTITLL